MPDRREIGAPRDHDVGLMRHRVSRQESTATRGPTGQAVPAWSTVATYWARVENLTGFQLVNAAQLKDTIKHKITMRVVGPITVNTRFLFEGTGRVFNVEVVYRLEERNAYYELWCSEITGQV
jgi:SPP1 family predicted phage head-tail adaptor